MIIMKLGVECSVNECNGYDRHLEFSHYNIANIANIAKRYSSSPSINNNTNDHNEIGGLNAVWMNANDMTDISNEFFWGKETLSSSHVSSSSTCFCSKKDLLQLNKHDLLKNPDIRLLMRHFWFFSHPILKNFKMFPAVKSKAILMYTFQWTRQHFFI